MQIVIIPACLASKNERASEYGKPMRRVTVASGGCGWTVRK